MALTAEQLVYADKLFELRVRKSDGQVYEDLFVEVMTLKNLDFRPVKPQGSIGDRKNDGYMALTGVFHQVFAPEDLAKAQPKAVEKLEEDLGKLIAHWNTLCPVREFYFVVNDKFKGAYPTIEAALLKLKAKYGLGVCQPFLNKDLMSTFASLTERQVIGLVGHLPTPENIPDLDYSVFTDVLRHVLLTRTVLGPDAVLKVPDFKEKIEFNRISPEVGLLLTTANFQSGAVEKFFNTYSGFSKVAIRNKLAAIYLELKAKSIENPNGPHPGDVIFFGLLETVTPQPATPHWQDAAIILLGYFFESCDIYEDPKNELL